MENDNFDAQEEVQKMNLVVDVQEKSACERHIKIEVSREDVDRYFNDEFDKLQQERAIPGFRAGKAPRKMIEKRFRKEIQEPVKNAIVYGALEQAYEDQNLSPISEPKLDMRAVTIPEEGPFIFEFDVEVRPSFEVPNWRGLKLDKPVREFTSEDVDVAVKRIQASYGSLEDKDAPAESGDYVVCKVTFDDDGVVLSHADNEVIRIRPILSFHDCAIKDFDKLMKGAKPGDVRKTKLVLSDSTPNESLRGKEINGTFEIVGVKTAIIPEVDAEFLQMIGGFDNVGDFRDVVLDTLKRQLEYEQHQVARRQIAEQLTVGADWALPPEMLKSQESRELQRMIYELQRSGFTTEQIVRQLNLLRANSRKRVEQALKEHFILEAIADAEGIKAEENDYEIEVAMIAAQRQESARRVYNRIQREGSMDVLTNQIIERKVINLIMSEADYKEVPYKFEDDSNEEALDRAASADDTAEIPEVTEEDAKEAAREAAEGKKTV